MSPTTAPLLTSNLCDRLNTGEVVVSDVGAIIAGVDTSNQLQFILEVIQKAASGKLQPSKVAIAIRCAGVEPSREVADAIADALWFNWVTGIDTSITDKNDPRYNDPQDEELKTRLRDAYEECRKANLISTEVATELAEATFLHWTGRFVSIDQWRRKEKQRNTQEFYVQTKFNLLREESEGYAKMITLLNQTGAGKPTVDNIEAVRLEMQALIGYFDLDPNRVFTLVLDAFCNQLDNEAFLQLLSDFDKTTIAQLVGFNFSLDTAQSDNMFKAAAKLVQSGNLSLEAMLAFLSPSDADIASQMKEIAANLQQAISRIGVISLTSAADASADASQQPPPPLLRPKGQTAATLDLDATKFTALLTDKPTSADDSSTGNQKLRLLSAMISVGDWQHAVQLMKWLSAYGVKDFAAFPDIGTELCRLLDAELQQQFSTVYPGSSYFSSMLKSSGSTCSVIPELTTRLQELLQIIGHHLYHNVAALSKLVRLLSIIVTEAHTKSSNVAVQQVEAAKSILGANILPALSLIPSNVALVNDVWGILSQFPYTERFCFYSDLKEAAATSPLLTASAKLAETEIRRTLRRVTAPVNKRDSKMAMKPLARLLAKIMHANPLPVAEQLIRQVMGMPGMVASILESLRYLLPMAFDVITFAILKQLASAKKKLKEDGMNLEEWFQWLAAFTGLLARRYADVDVAPLLQYVANQLKGCESLDLLLLKELLTSMTGTQAVFQVSENQLDALAGSPTLKSEVITQGEGSEGERLLQRGTARMLAALKSGPPEQQLALPLLILVAQQRKLIVLQPQSTHLKLITELYDKCHEVTFQYAEYLLNALSLDEYKKLLPSIEELFNDYRIDTEIIFQLHRPIIRQICPPIAALSASVEEDIKMEEPEEEDKAAVEPAATTEEGEVGDKEDEEEEGAVTVNEKPDVEKAPTASFNAEPVAATAAAMKPEDLEKAAAAWQALQQQTAVLLPSQGLKGMTQTLYLTFWSLELYDLQVPAALYKSKMTQLKSSIRIAREDLATAAREADKSRSRNFPGRYGYSQQSTGPTIDVEQVTRDLQHYETVAARLPDELKVHQDKVKDVDARLRAGCKDWFCEGEEKAVRGATLKEFVQYCVVPRVLNSPGDALYTVRFLKKAHELDVQGFPVLNIVQAAFRDLGYLVRSSTPLEAECIGIFFSELFSMVERWRDLAVFQKECAKAHTFMAGFNSGSLANINITQYRVLTCNFHKQFFEAVSGCITSGDYMQIKNVMLVLNRTVKVFPVAKQMADSLLEVLQPVRDNDPREDLKTLTRMYCSAIEMRMRDTNKPMHLSMKAYAEGKSARVVQKVVVVKKAAIADEQPTPKPQPTQKAQPPPGFATRLGQAGGPPTVAAATGKTQPPSTNSRQAQQQRTAPKIADKLEGQRGGDVRQQTNLRPDAAAFVPGSGGRQQQRGPRDREPATKRPAPQDAQPPTSRDGGDGRDQHAAKRRREEGSGDRERDQRDTRGQQQQQQQQQRQSIGSRRDIGPDDRDRGRGNAPSGGRFERRDQPSDRPLPDRRDSRQAPPLPPPAAAGTQKATRLEKSEVFAAAKAVEESRQQRRQDKPQPAAPFAPAPAPAGPADAKPAEQAPAAIPEAKEEKRERRSSGRSRDRSRSRDSKDSKRSKRHSSKSHKKDKKKKDKDRDRGDRKHKSSKRSSSSEREHKRHKTEEKDKEKKGDDGAAAAKLPERLKSRLGSVAPADQQTGDNGAASDATRSTRSRR